MRIRIHEPNVWPAKLLSQACELYEQSFPPAERHDFDKIMALLRSPEVQDVHFLVAENGEMLHGLSIFRRMEEAELGYLWYICVDPETQGLGIGGKLYHETLDVLRRESESLKGLIFEVERLDSDPESEYGHPLRRIRFYERLGARLIMGYDYWQPPIPPYDAVPLQLMFHPMGLKESECDHDALTQVLRGFLSTKERPADDIPADGLRLELLSDALAEHPMTLRSS